MALAVRPATVDDVPALVPLLAELDAFYGDTVTESDEQRAAGIREALFGETALSRALVAVDGDELVGLASYSLLWPAAGVSRSLYLKELYVRQSRRQQGVGRLLMNEIRRAAKQLGCSRLEWTTDLTNSSAREFYEKLGAVPIDTGKMAYRSIIDK